VAYSPASAREITVDDNGLCANFKSIQEAVNNSSSGDTVIVMPGTYEENIIVNVTSLTIRSESKNPGVLVKSPDENKSAFLIIANNVTLSGFNITGAKGNYTYYPAGICLKNARNCKIEGNILFEDYLGVCLVNADQNTVSENFLFNNSISLVEGSNLNNLTDNTLEGGPIYLSYASYNTISGNFLLNDSISLSEGSSMNNLTNNTVERGSIFLAAWSSGNLISKNKITNGRGVSFACCGGGDTVSDNTISNCSIGVFTYDRGLDIINNKIMDCDYGIDIDLASGTRIYNNTILNCSVGINVMDSSTEILNNIIISSAECGISIPYRESDERIYNNYFNNTINVRLESHGEYIWNNSRTSGTSIVGGPYLGGNYWAKPDGTGFSETCTDSNGDWICDSPYNINESDFDFLPLASISRPQKTPVANYSTNTTQGLAPLAVQFTDLSQYALLWNWDFDNDGISDSTEKDPVYEYRAPGSYTVNLTVSNANGAASKTQEIIAQEAEVLPVADFSANATSGQAPFSVLFTDLSQNIAKRTWDLNNDGITDSTNKTVDYVYTLPGIYIVNLTVSNSKGVVSKLLTVTASPVQRIDGQFILTEYQITTNESNQVSPAIYEDRIVWCDDRNRNGDIYMYNLSTHEETQITTSESGEFSPDIYSDRIVWTDFRNGDGDIFMYNLSTKEETQITISGLTAFPEIYEDRIVWADYRNGDEKNLSNSDIYMYNLSTHNETQITNSKSNDVDPDIYGDKIVWYDHNTSEYSTIHMYDLSTSKETQITSNESRQSQPAIYRDRIIWRDERNGNYSIYVYNLSTSTEIQITANQSDLWPFIYEDKIVWIDYRNRHPDVYMYDLSTSKETQITTNGSTTEPAIYGDRIVWQDFRNGNSDIYMCIISEQEESPVADFSAPPIS
jgi:beta propeller repeat protein/parallel beta-helix repeat protein